MTLIERIAQSAFGFKGKQPEYGIKPDDKLHDTYSLDGSPTVRLISSVTAILPQPTKLAKSSDLFTEKKTYIDSLSKA